MNFFERFLQRAQIMLRLAIIALEKLDRIRVVWAIFVFGTCCILFTAFRYSVIEYAYYRGLAEKQQIKAITNPVSRGSIYSNNDPSWVFATSTDIGDVAIDPKQIGSRLRLESFLVDILYREFCFTTSSDMCRENVMAFYGGSQTMDIFPETREGIREYLLTAVRKRLDKKYADFVLVRDGLSEEQLSDLSIKLPSNAFTFLGNALYVNPTLLGETGSLVALLQSSLNMPPSDIAFRLAKREVRYIKFIRRMSLATKDMIDQRITEERALVSKGLLKEEDSVYNFFIIESSPTRFYPEKEIASQITGFVDHNGVWHYGIEGYYDDELRGKNATRLAKKDISGRVIGGYTNSLEQNINGVDIRLTIDRNIQKELSRILAEGIREFRANKGSVLVMDPKTGAIVAMATYPDYDPNNFGDVYAMERVSRSKYPNPSFDLLGMPLFVDDPAGTITTLIGDKKLSLRSASDLEIENAAIPKYKYKNNFWPGVYVSDAIGSLYEPGSVFKAITVAIGIDSGDISPTDRYTDKGFVTIDNFKIKNVSAECIGFNTFLHALDWSCNVWMIHIVEKIGKSLFYKYILDFGFGAPTGIALEGEVFGKIDPYEKWSRAKLFTQSFGQGITATVLQMAAAYSVIANGGVYMQPYIVDQITYPDGTVVKQTPRAVRRVIQEETSKKLIAMLTEGATIGFARKGWVDGYDIAGKTGTSQIASKWSYEQGGAGHTITSYGWFGPSANPKFVMIVKVDRPRSAEYSETTSSALFSRMAKYLLNYYSIPKNR